MSARLHILTLFLLAGCLSARGQDLRTGIALDSQYLAAGEFLAWLDEDGNIVRTRPLERTLTALVESGGQLYALDDDGRELIALTKDGHITGQESLPVLGRLCSLAAEKDVIWAVTDAGEIVHGSPGSGWKVLDFNAQYAGYYPPMTFWAIAVGGGSIFVAGTAPGGTPAVFTSSRGTVWSERTLDYTEAGLTCTFTALPMGLSYDSVQDRFYLLGSGGEELALPGCSHCNSHMQYPVNTLYARIATGFGTLLLGSDGFRKRVI
jgi:hypothetical protein